jgi:predicted nucleic acid-binding protein
LGEVLVKPFEANDAALLSRYRSVFCGPSFRLLPFDEAAAERYARIRLNRGIKAPDAIQLATAAAGCELFITNDDRLLNVRVPGIHFIVGMDRAPI